MTRRALQVLEFGRVLEYAAGFASTSGGREAVLAMRPARERGTVQDRLAAVDETGRFLAETDEWVFPDLPDADVAVKRLAVDGAVLSPRQLAEVGGLLAAGATLLRSLNRQPVARIRGGAHNGDPSNGPGATRYPTLEVLGARLLAEPRLESTLRRAVDAQGTVLDGASRELRRIRGRLTGAHNRVVAHLEQFLDGVGDRHRVPGASVTIREGRYVIPLRREGKRTVGGYVHDESSSGATVFVEPPSAIEMMNRVRELERAETREVDRILRELTDRCRPLAVRLADSLAALTEMDRRVALSRAANRWEGCVPEVTEGPLRIRGGRHPLLVAAGVDAVPFDFELDDGEGVVVVTGPNTGGKTVFLKSVGLVAALAQSGIIPPAGPGTRLPVFDTFFADVGDEQSIADSLSTFSAHLRNLREVLEVAGPRSLVLIDEPGAGTDPKEGEALARSLIETLAERGCTAVVTSHLGGLKRLGREGSRIVNASLHFDGERLAPTYRFTKGRPGRSYGLAIARGLGFPDDVLDRAEAYRDTSEARLDDLLESLERKEQHVSRLLAELDGERKRTAILGSELEARAAELRRSEREHAARARREARRMLLDARAEVEAAIADLADRVTTGESLEEASRRARRTVEVAARGLEVPTGVAPDYDRDPDARLEPGAKVIMVNSGARGRVVAVEGDRVIVTVGGVRMKVSPGWFVVEGEGGAGPAADLGQREPAAEARGGGGWTAPRIEAVSELDLRGQRVDEAETSLSRALDAASVADLRELRVIHGMGTGALRERVAKVLGRDARVERFRAGKPGEGGYGVTVARIR